MNDIWKYNYNFRIDKIQNPKIVSIDSQYYKLITMAYILYNGKYDGTNIPLK